MRLRDLEWVVALAHHEHMTDTAAALRVPQSTVSRALTRVEEELGATLFERLPTGLRLTPLGGMVLEAARNIDDRYRRLRSDIATELDPESGVVRLAFLDSTGTALVPRILRRFRALAPNVRVSLRQEPGHEIIADLEARRADLALARARPDGGYGWLPLSREKLVLAVPPGHRLAGRGRVHLSELADDAFVTTPRGFGFRAQTDALLAAAGIAPEISFEAEDAGTIEGLVAAGLGVAIVPASFAGATESVGVSLGDVGAVREIGLVWRTDVRLSAPAERLRALVTEEFVLRGEA